jgi:hypothetical protein
VSQEGAAVDGLSVTDIIFIEYCERSRKAPVLKYLLSLEGQGICTPCRDRELMSLVVAIGAVMQVVTGSNPTAPGELLH